MDSRGTRTVTSSQLETCPVNTTLCIHPLKNQPKVLEDFRQYHVVLI